jgi:outer membrane protein OmpA-like peptidoglycan-associated protein
MLASVADRLNKSPDAELSIYGYYSPNSDDVDDLEGLARRRAEAVKSKLSSLGGPAARIKVVESGFDMGMSRVGTPDDQINKKSLEYQLDENRRVELGSWFVSGKDFLLEVPYTNSLTSQARDMISGKMSQIKSLLTNNTEVTILVDAYSEEGDEAMADKVFYKAADIARFIKSNIDDPEMKKRVYLNHSTKVGADPNKVLVFPVSEGVIYRPLIGDHVINELEVEEEEMNTVNVEATVQAGVDSFAITIVDKDERVIRTLATGSGKLPSGLKWDWRDGSGVLLDYENKYYAKLELYDRLGESVITKSDAMEIQITREAKRIESLVIVIFIFDEDTPKSKFLSSRIEYVADRLISRAKKNLTVIDATVTGHTDSIGAEYANNALSVERADRELKNLRRYMIYLLDLQTETQLDEWLKKHNVSLKAKGYGERHPYEIIRWSDEGERERVRLGDNSHPEGRTVNRRVLLEIRSLKKVD